MIAQAPDKPDLILLDVMMPGMDGYEVCRRLKSDPTTREIPVIFLTGLTDEADEEKGFEVGAVDYIHKPFSAPLVLARAKTQLTLRTALDQAREARQQADDILHALLPRHAADEIRSIGTVVPRRYENVAVISCKARPLPSHVNRHEPEEIISGLDALFVILERVSASYGLEKIKTLGQEFMAAAGLLDEIADPVRAAVACGLEMTSAFDEAKLDWELRIGISAGSVVAGVVGQHRYQFDLWGEPVDIASQIADVCSAGRIATTASIFEWIAQDFVGHPLGELEIKGDGKVSVTEILDRS